MNATAIQLFQFGHRRSVEQVARAASAFWIGLVLGLITAIPRNYDQFHLSEHTAKWLFGPLVFSTVSGFLMWFAAYRLGTQQGIRKAGLKRTPSRKDTEELIDGMKPDDVLRNLNWDSHHEADWIAMLQGLNKSENGRTWIKNRAVFLSMVLYALNEAAREGPPDYRELSAWTNAVAFMESDLGIQTNLAHEIVMKEETGAN